MKTGNLSLSRCLLHMGVLFGSLPLLGIMGCGSLSRIPGDNLVAHSPPFAPLQEQSAAPVIPANASSTDAMDETRVVPAMYASADDGAGDQVQFVGCLNGCPPGANCSCGGHQSCPNCGGGTGCGCACGAVDGYTYQDPSEYIFDGGDGHLRVVVQKDRSAAGVDPTDTIAYYETAGGQICVAATNRVPIYAPRFAAVRKVTGVVLSAHAVGTQRMLAPVAPERFEDSDLAGSMMQPVAPVGEAQVRLLDAFQENRRGIPIEQILPLERMSEARVPFELVDFFRTGVIRDNQVAVLGRILAGARTWFVPESLAVAIKGEDVALARDTQAAGEFFVYNAPDGCSLRICKAASHTIADSGDIVSFTIRLDNVGVKPILNAVVLDSLSPRLEYIEDSQQCSFDAHFSASPNEAGSSVLRWELSTEIEPSDGGVISFDCRVR